MTQSEWSEPNEDFKCENCGYEGSDTIDFTKNRNHSKLLCNDCAEDNGPKEQEEFKSLGLVEPAPEDKPLKDKIIDGANTEGWHKCIKVEDVKKAVADLKGEFAHSPFCDEPNNMEDIFKLIDKIFGDFDES